MGNADSYRWRAAELVDLAGQAADPELASIYLNLAFHYRRLADWVEHRAEHELSLPHLPDSSQCESAEGFFSYPN